MNPSWLLRMPHLATVALMSRDLRTLTRLHFLHAAADSGLLRALRTPATREEALRATGAADAGLAGSLLDLGVALGELALADGRYRLRGRRARTLAADDADGYAAWLHECVGYHADVFQRFAGRARGEPPGDYLPQLGTIVARSSRILEPMVAGFVERVVRGRRPARLLEIGCGSGVYLRRAALAHPALAGTGLDLDAAVVEQARANLARWGLADRFRLLVADVRRPPADLGGPFDLATLYNNLYYFPEGERIPLFRRVRGWLSAGGALALVCVFRDGAPETCNFDLVLRSTRGCTPLPDLAATAAQLREAGFARVRTEPLGPGGLQGVEAGA